MQASVSAVISSTPIDTKKSVNVLCLSSILEAISIPDSVRVMSPSPSIVICPLAFSLFVVYVTLGFVTPR